MAVKSVRNSKPNNRNASMAPTADPLLDGRDFLDPFAVGSWTPPVDICQTKDRILVRIDLPGVEPADIALSFREGCLRIQGIKREQAQPRKLLCFYCLERRYGWFDRRMPIKGVLNPRLGRAYLEKGVLTVDFPQLEDRRGELVEIKIEKK